MSEKLDRRTFLAGTGAVGLTTIAGCVGGSGGDDGATNVAMVYALGGLGDKSFNDMAKAGITRAKEELDVQYEEAEPSGTSDFSTYQERFAGSTNPDYDLVCCIGFNQVSDLEQTADDFGDQKFMLVDGVVQTDNVASYTFKEHQGSFQVGYLAGMLTTREFSHEDDAGDAFETKPDEKVVGFVGGQDNSLIKKFEAGYKAGVHHADEEIEVRAAYAGSWSDSARGKEIAVSMYEAGADIVYHAAGGTGVGVFNAAKEKGRLAIGVDSDQSLTEEYSSVVVASMVKHVDKAVFNSVKNVTEDGFRSGENIELGLEQDGVAAVIGKDYEGEIPQEITSKLESSKEAINNGEIDVPTSPGDA